jgi:hypothetical protein
MGDISIIEWIVYGIMCYGTMVMTLVTLVKEIPQTRDLALSRVFFTLPGMICAGVLAMSGINIVMPTTTLTNITKDLNSSTVWSQTTTQASFIVLQNPVWIMIHVMFFMVLFWFIVTQVMFILKDPKID